jgi:hypothetical protein
LCSQVPITGFWFLPWIFILNFKIIILITANIFVVRFIHNFWKTLITFFSFLKSHHILLWHHGQAKWDVL